MLRNETIRRVLHFRDERDWRQFHTPKDLAISMSLEASELLEIFYELRGLDEDGKKVSMAASATYGEVKMWFLTQFPEIEKMGENVDKIIDAARKARADKKNAA